MNPVETYRKQCLAQQTELRSLMENPAEAERAIQLFLRQHAMLHSQKMAQTETWSFEDEALDGLTAAQIQHIPPGCEHSIAWLIWHMARCEDITMNLLVAGTPQILFVQDWYARMGAAARDTGNAMDPAAMAEFSRTIQVEALRGYRIAVGRRTRAIVQQLQPEALKRKVDSARIQQVMDEGAVLEAARGIADYWSKRDVAGLLLMPASRHNLTHLGEALELKRKVKGLI